VFDLNALSYLSPIAVGNAPTELALTPDGALLAVVNSGDGTVSAINPTTMLVVATYPVLTASDMDKTGCGGVPFLINAVEPHRMLVSVNCSSVLDSGTVHLLDLNTGSLTCTGTPACDASGTNVNVGAIAPKASTSDGSQVFIFTGSPTLLNYSSNTATSATDLDQWSFWSFGDAAADDDGTVFAFGGALYDADCILRGAAVGSTAMIYGSPYFGASLDPLLSVYGKKLNSSGSLLYLPMQSATPNPGFIDIFDVHTGRLALRVGLPEHVPAFSVSVLNTMAIDETGTKLFVISDSGITVAQLSQLPLSLATVRPTSGTIGTQVTLKGSGFQAGSMVTFGTTTVAATFVDPQTLSVTVPNILSGPTRVTITNPDGGSYAFDDAFVVN